MSALSESTHTRDSVGRLASSNSEGWEGQSRQKRGESESARAEAERAMPNPYSPLRVETKVDRVVATDSRTCARGGAPVG